MKILWLNHRDPKHPNSGGSEIRIREIGKRLVQNGHSVKLVCERWPGSKKSEFLDGIEIERVASKYSIHLKVPFLLNMADYDFVIDDIAHAIPWESQFFTNKCVIAQVHHVHQEVLKFELNPLLARIIGISEKTIKYYNRIIAVSESTKNALINDLGVSGNKIKIITNGIDVAHYRPSTKASSPTILWVGRVKRYKRVDHVLLAFNLIFKQIPNAELIIAGNGDYLENIKKVAGNLHLPNVIFTGAVDEQKKVSLMASSWVTVSSSLTEGWGMTITESAACGTPAVAYDVAGLRDSIRNNETGLLASDGNVNALAQAILQVLQDNQLRETLSKNASRSAKEFSWDKVAKEFIDFLASTNNRR
ncbi:MAG: glycosyltransferase family 4 protein [Candidatus Bathyarchaeia archaeon]